MFEIKKPKIGKQILEKIHNSARICIFRHQSPDFDALGTQMGLYYWIKENFPDKEVHFVGDINKSFIPRIFELPETVDDSFFDKDFLAIILDTGNCDRIADERYKKASFKIKIDHHPEVEEYGELSLVISERSSSAEIVASMCLNCKRTFMSPKAARYFYIGIVGDSGRFMYSSTSAETLRIGALLIDTGLEIDQIYQTMYEKQASELEVIKYLLNNYQLSKEGTCFYVFKNEDLKKFGMEPSQAKININLFSNYQGIEVVVSVAEDIEKGCFHVSIRSRRKIINKIAASFNGGGHPLASGAKLNSLDELPSLIEALDKAN